MRSTPLFHALGLLMILLSISFIPPILVDFCYQENHALAFSHCAILSLFIGILLWFPFRKHSFIVRTQDGFLLVLLFWCLGSLISALPFYLSPPLKLSFIDALFESVSGLTTTGSTIFKQIDGLPHAILYYRQQLQFLGGISIILLAVAILPMLSIGGMQLFRAEIAGPIQDDKFTPRVSFVAKNIWLVYICLTLVCMLCYRLAGMTWFDALSHSFSTISTGGFSTHDASLAFFASNTVNTIAIVFMFLGSVSFNLHFMALKGGRLNVYRNNAEFKFYLRFLFLISLIIFTFIALTRNGRHFSLLGAFFEVISFTTTSGFKASPYVLPGFTAIILLFCGMIGGCTGSTSGGIKMARLSLLSKMGKREINRLIHPHGQYVIKFGDQTINTRVVEAVLGFFALYFVVFALLLLLLLITETSFLSAFTAVAATLSNTGLAMGTATHDFSAFSDLSKTVLCFSMIAGRLEILTILVLFSPAFWKR